ncbi:hypothetical protein GYMLUDRAFT_252091 [Collybiopsis luxurians FD-317 M1]|uniref:Uncharacterized protein n=1 Tax=Collybiopsis luxurians FD-317 M1 TaxID=944289 RepID=A0A0D0AMD6_9AGAR|nr:hypothetical protein GYMLUDRAFT_252091 [Collybiopsis luxurians FD-317 M1]
MTLAFAAMNVQVYAFWWNRPPGVKYPIPIQRLATLEDTGDLPLPVTSTRKSSGQDIASSSILTWPCRTLKFIGGSLSSRMKEMSNALRRDYEKIGMLGKTFLLLTWILERSDWSDESRRANRLRFEP